MASAAYSASLQGQAQPLRNGITKLTNDVLKRICREEGLAVSGTKAVLQKRISQRIDDVLTENRVEAFNTLRDRIIKLAPSSGSRAPPPPPPAASTYSAPNGTAGNMNGSRGGNSFGSAVYTSRIQYKESPFLSKIRMLAPALTLHPTQNGKGTLTMTIKLDEQTARDMQTNKDLRITLFGAPETELGPWTSANVAFPQYMEVKLNQTEFRHTWKGLKNKPGSTKPADITNYVQKRGSFNNQLQVTYAYTDKKWYLEVYLAEKHSIPSLVRRIEASNHFSKERVLQDMRRQADDPDIEATSSVMSLKDPITFMRIQVPVRSTNCSHNSCFDAEGFLSLQEQAPTWTCPLCNRAVTFQNLTLDKYFQEILQQTPSSTEQVTVEPDGRWSAGASKITSNGNRPNWDDDSDDDDFKEIAPPGQPAIKNELRDHSNSFLSAATPPISARPSAGPGSGGGSKRKSEVIDLTLSSDDDDGPPAPKRAAYGTPNGHSDAYGRTSNGSCSHNANYAANSAAHSRPSVSHNTSSGSTSYPHHPRHPANHSLDHSYSHSHTSQYPRSTSYSNNSNGAGSGISERLPPMRTSSEAQYPPDSHGSSNSSGSYYNTNEYR